MHTVRIFVFLTLLLCLSQQTLQAEKLTASWYSIASLIKEGTHEQNSNNREPFGFRIFVEVQRLNIYSFPDKS
jgi:hypothetical protein